jgi:hypothetical protein
MAVDAGYHTWRLGAKRSNSQERFRNCIVAL